MSSQSDDPTSDDGGSTEPLAFVEATLDDCGPGDGDVQSDEPQAAEQPEEGSAGGSQSKGETTSDEPKASEQPKVADPTSDVRVASFLPKRGRPRGPPRAQKVSRPRGRPSMASQSPRMTGPASEFYESMLQMSPSSQPKSYSNRANVTPALMPMASPISTPVVQPPRPPSPPRPKHRGRPSLASQTPRMPGPASEFYKALVNMHDCLKWDRKVLYRYERNPATSEQSQNGAGTGQPAQGSQNDKNSPSPQGSHNVNKVATASAVTSQGPTGAVRDIEKNSTSYELNNATANAANLEVKVEPVLDLGEENTVAIGTSFSLTDVSPDALPVTLSETSTRRDQGDSNASDGGTNSRNKKVVGAPTPTASVSTYYLLGTNRGLKTRKCVVPHCIRPLDPHFSFPKDKNLCLKWLLAIPKGNWSLNEQSVVCARHFDRTNISWKTRTTNSVTLTMDAVPKLFLHNPPITNILRRPTKSTAATNPTPPSSKNTAAIASTAVSSVSALSAPGTTADSPTADASATEPLADISETQEVSLVQQGNGVFKIEMSEDDSESDLEIIEPHIETYEVSDTSDEGESAENKEGKDGKDSAPISIVGVNSRKDVSSTGKLYNRRGDGNIIKCCVPRCGSYTGSPSGVGFHTFPVVGETRLSVRSLDSKVTVHDLCSMWKSLLSVPDVTEDSYVCTRHFTVNDYIYNTLNKAAVPTQFLPTPVMFAPCRIEKSLVARPPPPLFILRNPQQQQPPARSMSSIRIRAPAILRGAPRTTQPSTLNQIQNRIVNHVLTVGPNNTVRAQNVSGARVFSTLPGAATAASASTTTTTTTAALPPPLLPKPAVMRLGCAIPDCPNKTYEEGSKPIFFRLPPGIEKCKEWVYSCGHPEWLDKGMFFARAKFRICAEHFPDEMFLGSDHKMLKGFAKPCIKVQEPYKKCVVKSCHNYYDKERLHHIGVDFAPFPDREKAENRLTQWIQAVKNTEGDVSEEDLKKYENAVICSLHFRNSDYVAGPVGKRLGTSAVPSMNLVVKDPQHLDDNEEDRKGDVELEKPTRSKNLSLSARRLNKRRRLLKWHEERRKREKEAKEKALAEGRPWPPPKEKRDAEKEDVEGEPKKKKRRWDDLPEAERQRRMRRYSKKGCRLLLSAKPKKKTVHQLMAAMAARGVIYKPKKKGKKAKSPVNEETTQADAQERKKQKLDNEGDGDAVSDAESCNEEGTQSRRKAGGRRTRSTRQDSEDSSEDESRDGSWDSGNEGRQLRGRRARPLRQAVLASSKKSKYADSEDGESSGSGRRRRKHPRLEDETIYTQAPITRASARAAAAKNKKIYAEDSESDNQQGDNGDQGVPDEDYNATQEIERPQGTHFLDPDFRGLEDMAMDSMDALENCLETVLLEQPNENSLEPPDLGPPEKGKDFEEVDQNKAEDTSAAADSEVLIKDQDVSFEHGQVSTDANIQGNPSETKEVVEGRQLRFGRKARTAPQYHKKKRRGRRGRAKSAVPEQANTQADDSGINKPVEPVDDLETVDSRVPTSAMVEEGSKEISTEQSVGTVEAGPDRLEEDVTEVEKPPSVEPSQEDNDGDIPADKAPESNDTAESPVKCSSDTPPEDKTDTPPGEEPPDSAPGDEKSLSQEDPEEDDDSNCVPYGPKVAKPTSADMEFFRSIIPTMAKFSQHQRAILKATVISTLQDMLGEEIGVKLDTTEELLNELPLPSTPD